jgi:glutamate/tyrosine decarboxylase-like PLP-dependent enzyme
LPEHEPLFKGMHEADSIALDPHKWLYAPLEAGCILVKDHQHLLDTYSAHPAYYNFEGSDGVTTVNYYEYGFQNSRGFKALKVWLGLQQAGRAGYADLIREDIRLSEHMYDFAVAHPELEAVSQQLSIATFRYVPPKTAMSPDHGEAYLNALNERLLNELQQGGELFLSDAIVQGKYCLRACVVNYRTSMQDIDEVMEIVVREGRKVSELFMPGL